MFGFLNLYIFIIFLLYHICPRRYMCKRSWRIKNGGVGSKGVHIIFLWLLIQLLTLTSFISNGPNRVPPKGSQEQGCHLGDHISALSIKQLDYIGQPKLVGLPPFTMTSLSPKCTHNGLSVSFYKVIQLNSLVRRHINEDRNVNNFQLRDFLTYFVKTNMFPADFQSAVRNKCVSCFKEDSGEVAIITGFR